MGQEIVNCFGYSCVWRDHGVVWKSVQEGDLGCSCIFKDHKGYKWSNAGENVSLRARRALH